MNKGLKIAIGITIPIVLIGGVLLAYKKGWTTGGKEGEFNRLKNSISDKAYAGLNKKILTDNKSDFIKNTTLLDMRFLSKVFNKTEPISNDDKQRAIRIIENSGVVK